MKIRVGLALLLVALFAGPALALVERLTPLSEYVSDSDQILLMKVERIDAAKPAVWLTVSDSLKGKAEFERLAVNAKGDKPEDSTQLLERIDTDLPLVVFVTTVKKQKYLFAYSNGVWLQIIGRPDGDQTRWAFTHLEPYLVRTFAGTTDELQKVVVDALAGKAKPPAPDAKRKPSIGSAIEKREPKAAP